MERIVIKVGGASLFQPGGFTADLMRLLDQNRNAKIGLVVGGGDLVEAMRTAHAIYPQLDQEEIHWRCVELLDHTWAIANQVFPTEQPIENRDQLIRFSNEARMPEVNWIRVQSFYHRSGCDSIPPSWLPRSNWNTTSDAIAWLLAKIIDADRVILMKKCKCDSNWTLAEAANCGAIDTELVRLTESNPGTRPIIELAWA